jgi:hypothetical protein
VRDTPDRRIVCAACKHTDGRIVTGPRHFDVMMWSQVLQVPPLEFINRTQFVDVPPPPEVQGWGNAEQGFIDQYGSFHTREEAWLIADAAGQIINDREWVTGRLHSEHLY